MTDKTATDFGTVTIGADGVRIEATGAELRGWANRSGAAWPCSHLARLEGLRADFDANGLSDIEATGLDLAGWEDADVSADEFNAWSSDTLRAANLPSSHPRGANRRPSRVPVAHPAIVHHGRRIRAPRAPRAPRGA